MTAFLTALPWEMSRSIIAAIANFMFVCVVCLWACRLQSVSLRIAAIVGQVVGFMLCFVCVSLCVSGPVRVQLGVGNVPLYHHLSHGLGWLWSSSQTFWTGFGPKPTPSVPLAMEGVTCTGSSAYEWWCTQTALCMNRSTYKWLHVKVQWP